MRGLQWLGALTVVCAAVGVLPVHGAVKPDPRAVNLSLNDLPTGFTLKSNVSRNNAQAIKAGDQATIAQENASGRVLSNDVIYDANGLVGLLEVESTVIQYRSASYALAAFQENTKAKLPAIFKPMSTGPLGTGRIAFIATVKKGDISGTVVEIIFVRGVYRVNVEGEGLTNTFQPTAVYNLAKAVDKHILKHG